MQKAAPSRRDPPRLAEHGREPGHGPRSPLLPGLDARGCAQGSGRSLPAQVRGVRDVCGVCAVLPDPSAAQPGLRVLGPSRLRFSSGWLNPDVRKMRGRSCFVPR